jgi:hypothetical protein
VHLVMSGVFDDEDSFTFAQWRDCQTGQPGDGRLVSGAVADDQRTAVVRQCLDDPLERRAEQPTFVLDKIRINSPHVFERGSFAGRLGGFPPPVFDRRPQRDLCDDRCLILIGSTAQDAEHFGGSIRTGGDEQRVRRVQAGAADGFRVRDAPLAQPVAVVVGVPAQLDISHASILPPGRLGRSGQSLGWWLSTNEVDADAHDLRSCGSLHAVALGRDGARTDNQCLKEDW